MWCLKLLILTNLGRLKDKVMGLICDNQLFLKQTEAGKALQEKIVLAPAYEGSKDFFLISDELDEGPKLCELIRESFKELPAPRKKAKAK